MERGRNSGMLGLLALQAMSDYWRLDRKPPVTAALLAANTLVYLRPPFLDPILPTLDQVLFNPHRVIKDWDLKRFFLSPFYHIGEYHVFYNMMSLLWKGIRLENSMGSVEFASMVGSLLVMSQCMSLLLAKSLLLFFDYEKCYYNEYAVGFSSVLFAMKVALNSQSDGHSNIYGIFVPTRYAAWAELIIIQLIIPNVSFLGHLSGILAGMLYLRLKASHSGPDPLSAIIRSFTRVLSWPLRFVWGFNPFSNRRIYGRGTVGTQSSSSSGVWRCRACTFDNSGFLNVCEVCGTGRSDAGLSSSQISHERLALEELRRRRVERFRS